MAQYPSAAGTDANLWVSVNNKSTSLTDNPLTSGATTVNVASTSGFPTAGYITIEAEAIKYTGVTGTSFTGCTRGSDGTSAASHVFATQVFHDVVADHHNVLKDEIKAIEGDLVGTLSAITPVTATSTATSVLNRLAMVVSQIKKLGGLTNWYDASGQNINAAGYMVGTVVQALQFVDTASTTSSGTTYTATTTTQTITPKATTHKIRVTVNGHIQNIATGNIAVVTVKRAGTDLDTTGNGFATATAGATNEICPVGFSFLDSPASTSALAYTVNIKSSIAADTKWNVLLGSAVILIEEIAF